MKNIIMNIIPNLKECNGTYGLEIEAEGINLPLDIDANKWRVELDGSLKSGFEAREYVFPKPTSYEEMINRVEYLWEKYNKNKSKVYDTIASGIHTHINVQQYTPKQVFTLITVYFTVEALVLKFCGPSREGNHFCLRLNDAEYLLNELIRTANTRKFANLRTDNLRYCSLNVTSLFKYGSIELRGMKGTSDKDAVLDWCRIVHQITTNSKKFASPLEVLTSLSHMGEEEFLATIFDEGPKWYKKIPDYKNVLRDSMRQVQALAFAVDWTKWKDVNVNPFKVE